MLSQYVVRPLPAAIGWPVEMVVLGLQWVGHGVSAIRWSGPGAGPRRHAGFVLAPAVPDGGGIASSLFKASPHFVARSLW